MTIAVLGLLNDTPLHGYELRKRLDVLMGALRRRISFGSLYPALRQLEASGWITQSDPTTATPPLAGRRARVVYQLTAAGEEHLHALLSTSGPAAWEDEQFDIHFAFFGRTDAETRLRILQGRRTRVFERLERVRGAVAVRDARTEVRAEGRPDSWAAELQRHGMESLERELRWLEGLIDRERGAVFPEHSPPPHAPAAHAPPATAGQPPVTTPTSATSEPTGQLSTNQ